jgi:hypothetical protein
VGLASRADQSWRQRAACRGRSEIFWPAEPHPSRYLQAQRICGACPVIDACRAYADEHRVEGVWAGEMRFGTSRREASIHE